MGALEKFKLWESEVQRGQKEIFWTEEASLPQGWKVSFGLEEGKEILMDEEGTRFEGRKEAIDQLIKEQRSPGDIFKLWSTLHRDGWVADEEKLPTGWKKKYFASEGCHHYLSPMMQVGNKSATKKLPFVAGGGWDGFPCAGGDAGERVHQEGEDQGCCLEND